jgi:hypothetical protein
MCIDSAGFRTKIKITMDFCFYGAILDLKAFCFGAIPDIMIELIVYGSVPQSRQSYLLRKHKRQIILTQYSLIMRYCDSCVTISPVQIVDQLPRVVIRTHRSQIKLKILFDLCRQIRSTHLLPIFYLFFGRSCSCERPKKGIENREQVCRSNFN